MKRFCSEKLCSDDRARDLSVCKDTEMAGRSPDLDSDDVEAVGEDRAISSGTQSTSSGMTQAESSGWVSSGSDETKIKDLGRLLFFSDGAIEGDGVNDEMVDGLPQDGSDQLS